MRTRMIDEPKLDWRWGWQFQWFGWRRCLWLAVMIDVGTPVVAVMFFGLMLSYGKNVLAPTTFATTPGIG